MFPMKKHKSTWPMGTGSADRQKPSIEKFTELSHIDYCQ
ncbi:hypothetical protein FM107_09020 [Sphingobacterium sp. JB170]|nr:hypothetical protein FM107_09020 [Sphingobacterium sp. JB170]